MLSGQKRCFNGTIQRQDSTARLNGTIQRHDSMARFNGTIQRHDSTARFNERMCCKRVCCKCIALCVSSNLFGTPYTKVFTNKHANMHAQTTDSIPRYKVQLQQQQYLSAHVTRD